MIANYKNKARQLAAQAREALAQSDDGSAIFAALLVRMAIECIVYHKAYCYRKYIPNNKYGTWKPAQIMNLLESIDQHSMYNSTITFKKENDSSEKPTRLGDVRNLSRRDIKKTYQNISSYLHMPTMNKMEMDKKIDTNRLKEKCEILLDSIDHVLASHLDSFIAGIDTHIECEKCGEIILWMQLKEPGCVVIECPNSSCIATYNLCKSEQEDEIWIKRCHIFECPDQKCSHKNLIWEKEASDEFEIICAGCSRVISVARSFVFGFRE